jgi:hypothetical protein
MNIRINKLLFLINALLMASTMAPTPVTAQEPDQTHPFLSDRFQLAVGAFARQQNFKCCGRIDPRRGNRLRRNPGCR